MCTILLLQCIFVLCITDVPVCRNAEPVVLGVGNGEMVDVFCDVVANPNVDAFHWAFNNSAGLIHVPAGRANTQNGTRSKLTYTPRNNKDYGTLMCEAKNEVGKQKQPCIFHIILAGKFSYNKVRALEFSSIFNAYELRRVIKMLSKFC